MNIRTPLAKARGLGSAHSGTEHWWLQRLTAVALIPLAIWMVYSALSVMLTDSNGVVSWLQSPVQALLLGAFILSGCWHGKLGMQVIVEDYVHNNAARTLLLVLNTLGFAVLAAMGIMATLKLHLF